MNNFFVAFSDLTEEKIFTSANIDIPCIDMEIDGDDGLILEEDKIIRFLTLLKNGNRDMKSFTASSKKGQPDYSSWNRFRRHFL